ncbi:sialidase family protein [Niabella insulamsoli]|uniref:sialidase family protein n=1 Tax=Niabella insulamsoli TaxID=3144874 RepID=UPI0031FC8A1D
MIRGFFIGIHFLLAGVMQAGASNAAATVAERRLPGDSMKYVQLFARKQHGYALFRIPTIVRSVKGTLLAFCEGRVCGGPCGDHGDINMLLRTSSDGGATWDDMKVIWDEGERSCGNPVPIVDAETGVIHLLMCLDNKRIFVTKSEDDGVSWSKPKEITASVKDRHWKFYGTGPVHGIQVQTGAYKGRLIATAYAVIPEGDTRQNFSFTIFSDDHGVTWQKGEVTRQPGVGECTIAETADGLLLNLRSLTHRARSLAISHDGGHTWSDIRIRPDLVDPKCQASMLSFKTSKGWTLLQANAAAETRSNMALKASRDNGQTWRTLATVFKGKAAYSDMVRVDENRVGIIFENGDKSPYDRISFTTLVLEML